MSQTFSISFCVVSNHLITKEISPLDYPSAHRVVKYSYLLIINVLPTTPL